MRLDFSEGVTPERQTQIVSCWLCGRGVYTVGTTHNMRVPVQFGKWSREPRRVEILAITENAYAAEEWKNDLMVTARITKGMRSAGRKFHFRVPSDQIAAVERA